MTDEAEFEIWQDDMCVAGCFGPRDRALQEARHYAAVYSQDGEVQVLEITRRRLSAEELGA